MKPIATEAWIVASEEAKGGPVFLSKGSNKASPWVVTHDLGCAHRFPSREDADEARSQHEERHHGQTYGVGGWKVLLAVTTTRFRDV